MTGSLRFDQLDGYEPPPVAPKPLTFLDIVDPDASVGAPGPVAAPTAPVEAPVAPVEG